MVNTGQRFIEVMIMAKCSVCSVKEVKRDWAMCPTCHKRAIKLIRKLALIELKGGKCCVCGWSGHPAGFVLHHEDPTSKEHEISRMMRHASWESILEEAKKCSLYCARCHNIHHSDDTEMVEELLLETSKRKRIGLCGDLYMDWLPNEVRDIVVANAASYAGHPTKPNGSAKKRPRRSVPPRKSSKVRSITIEMIDSLKEEMSWQEVADHLGVCRRHLYRIRKNLSCDGSHP